MKSAPGVPYLAAKVYSNEFSQLRAVGLNPLVPREFGGPGFPGDDLSIRHAIATLRPHWGRALRVCMAQGQASAVLLGQLQSPWSSRFGLRQPDLEDWVLQSILASHAEFVGPRGQAADGVSLEAFQRDVMARFENGFHMCRGWPPAKLVVLTPVLVRRRLDRVLAEINQRVPYPRLTDRPRALGEGLQSFLQQLRGPYYMVPPEFRVCPGIGAATVGV